MADISANLTPNFKDRIDIFTCLTTDEVSRKMDDEKFAALLGDFFPDFVDFCNFISPVAEQITSVTCYIESGSIRFETDPLTE